MLQVKKHLRHLAQHVTQEALESLVRNRCVRMTVRSCAHPVMCCVVAGWLLAYCARKTTLRQVDLLLPCCCGIQVLQRVLRRLCLMKRLHPLHLELQPQPLLLPPTNHMHNPIPTSPSPPPPFPLFLLQGGEAQAQEGRQPGYRRRPQKQHLPSLSLLGARCCCL
jgi:hypothetical protein